MLSANFQQQQLQKRFSIWMDFNEIEKKIVFVLENLRCAVVGVCVAVVAGMEKFHVWLFVIPISSRINGIRLTSISFHILMRITSREEQLQLATCHCHTHKQFCFFLKCSDRFILLYKLFIFISKNKHKQNVPRHPCGIHLIMACVLLWLLCNAMWES